MKLPVFALMVLTAVTPISAAAVPLHLRVEGLLEAVAVISEPTPRFSFLHGKLAFPSFGVTQASYRITVVATDATTADAKIVWDSGDVKSSNCSQIVYAGKALTPFTRYTWSAQWTSSTGSKSAVSTAKFETGPLAVSDWQGADWLRGCTLNPPFHWASCSTGGDTGAKGQFRNEFSVPTGKKLAFARAYVAAAGCAHIEVNGKVPQPDLRGICPWPVTTASVRYITHDITSLIVPGKNALGMVAGSVMKAPQAVLLVAIVFEDSPSPTFTLSSSTTGWMATASYVTTATAWASTIDWTKQEKGWSTTAFTPSPSWSVVKATVPGEKDGVSARALAMPLSTVLEEVKPISVLKTPDGGFLYTFAKNFVGTIKLQPLPSAVSGSKLTVLLGEWLVNATYPKISGGEQQYENHVLRAGNAEPLTTLFCWHGFQYVRVMPSGDTKFTGAVDAIVGQVIHTNMTATGSLTFGGEGDATAEDAAEVLTHINQMTLQSQRTNVAAYLPTDCPTREKHGWMGDALDGSEQALMNFEMGPVHEAFIQLVEDNQNPKTGDVPYVVPGFVGGFPGHEAPGKEASCNDIAWTGAYPQVAAAQHEYYGNTRTLARKFPSLVKYTENLISNANSSASNAHEGLAVCDQFRDWLCGNAQSCCTHKGSSSCPVGAEMGGFNYVLGLRAMSQMAAVLGNSTAAARYSQLASKGTAEFHSFFYNSSVGRYGGDIGATQSLSLPALRIGSPPASIYPTVVKTVSDDIKKINYTLAVGAVTSKILFNLLSENGLHEAALRTAINTDEPSIGHWWKKWNATTCYEAFPNSNSAANSAGTLNHIFLCGGIGHWMWKHLVGLTPAEPGFAKVSLIPRIHDSIGPKSVGGQFLSPKGLILSSWKLSSNATVSLSVALPVGVSAATIVVPKPTTDGKPAVAATIKLGGTMIWDGTKLVGKPDGVLSAKDQLEGVAFTTTNGAFEFESMAKS